MNRSNNMQRMSEMNPSSNVPRHSNGSSFRVSKSIDQGKNKHGLPYVPSTPSTRGSSYSGSNSRHSSISDESSELIDNSPQHISNKGSVRRQKSNVLQQHQQTTYGISRESERHKQRSRSQSPTKPIISQSPSDRSNRSNDMKNSRLSNHSHGKDNPRSQQHHPMSNYPTFYDPSIGTTPSSSNHSAKLSSTSTSSTASSQLQLLLPNTKSSSSFCSSNHDNQHPQQTRAMIYPNNVRKGHADDVDDEDDDETSFTEDDTIQTRCMIRYTQDKKQYNDEKAEVNEESDPFLNESFESIDFGSTLGVAPMLSPRNLLQPQRPNPRYDSHNENNGKDVNYDDNYDDDEALLYHNSNDQYDEESVTSFEEEEDAVLEEEVLLRQAVRRGSVLASNGYPNRSSDVVDDTCADQRHTIDRQLRSRNIVNPQILPQQHSSTKQTNTSSLRQALRRQKSMSITSKRHLLAASARGVVTKTSSHNDIEQAETSGKGRQRGTVRKVGSHGDIETPPQIQSRRGNVSKFSSRDSSIEISKSSPQQQQQKGSALKTSHCNNYVTNPTGNHRRSCVSKAASHGDILPHHKPNRTSVRKAASHGDFEVPLQERHGSPLRNHSMGNRLLPPPQQPMQQQSRRIGQQSGGAALSRRRSSLEHLPTMRQSSFRISNTAAMMQRQRSFDNDDEDDDEDQSIDNIAHVVSRGQNIVPLSTARADNRRRMSGEHDTIPSNKNKAAPVTPRSITRAKSQSDMSMNFLFDGEVEHENLNEISFSDLAARRW
jgi:hypothetical protein